MSATTPPVPDDHVIVLAGATGDLARRKVLPGLYHLALAGLLPRHYRIIGSAPRSFAQTSDHFRTFAHDAVAQFGDCPLEDAPWDAFAQNLSFAAADPDDPSPLVRAVHHAQHELGPEARRLFHLAIPPDAVATMIQLLGASGLSEGARVICEKPFGTNLASARTLNAIIAEHFDETRVFRIDHFLGKESVDNILALRFANELFESLWNRTHVHHVQIDVPETLSIEGRGAFFESTGTFRDMVITHLFQVLGFIAMEQPTSLDARPLRDEVGKVFDSLRPLDPDHVIYGQYEGYRSEPGVAGDSRTETFVALRAEVDNTRWKGVPFYLRTGKCLAESRQTVTVTFREPVMRLFPVDPQATRERANQIMINFADPGSIHTRFLAKQPGPAMLLGQALMHFRYDESFQSMHHLEAYEHLILQAMTGNQSLFTRADGIERLWEVAAPLLENPPDVQPYAPGSWGPASTDAIVAPHRWSLPE